jgi:hypothetical protein
MFQISAFFLQCWILESAKCAVCFLHCSTRLSGRQSAPVASHRSAEPIPCRTEHGQWCEIHRVPNREARRLRLLIDARMDASILAWQPDDEDKQSRCASPILDMSHSVWPRRGRPPCKPIAPTVHHQGDRPPFPVAKWPVPPTKISPKDEMADELSIHLTYASYLCVRLVVQDGANDCYRRRSVFPGSSQSRLHAGEVMCCPWPAAASRPQATGLESGYPVRAHPRGNLAYHLSFTQGPPGGSRQRNCASWREHLTSGEAPVLRFLHRFLTFVAISRRYAVGLHEHYALLYRAVEPSG